MAYVDRWHGCCWVCDLTIDSEFGISLQGHLLRCQYSRKSTNSRHISLEQSLRIWVLHFDSHLGPIRSQHCTMDL